MPTKQKTFHTRYAQVAKAAKASAAKAPHLWHLSKTISGCGVFAASLGFATLLFAGLAFAEPAKAPLPEYKVYKLGFAEGPSTIEALKAIVGKDVQAFYDKGTRQLFVQASSNQHAMVSTLVKQLDIPPKNVRVTVTFRSVGSEEKKSASIRGRGHVALNEGDTRTSIKIRPRIEDRRTEQDSATRQQLLVTSGRQATLFIGEEVPYIEWMMDYGYRQHFITQQVSWERVGSRLIIEPLVIGDGPTIRVRLTPELSGTVDGNPYRIRFAGVSTEIIATDGVPFTLGGLTEKNDFYSRFLVGRRQGGDERKLDIEMTAHVLPAFEPENPTRP